MTPQSFLIIYNASTRERSGTVKSFINLFCFDMKKEPIQRFKENDLFNRKLKFVRFRFGLGLQFGSVYSSVRSMVQVNFYLTLYVFKSEMRFRIPENPQYEHKISFYNSRKILFTNTRLRLGQVCP